MGRFVLTVMAGLALAAAATAANAEETVVNTNNAAPIGKPIRQRFGEIHNKNSVADPSLPKPPTLAGSNKNSRREELRARFDERRNKIGGFNGRRHREKAEEGVVEVAEGAKAKVISPAEADAETPVKKDRHAKRTPEERRELRKNAHERFKEGRSGKRAAKGAAVEEVEETTSIREGIKAKIEAGRKARGEKAAAAKAAAVEKANARKAELAVKAAKAKADLDAKVSEVKEKLSDEDKAALELSKDKISEKVSEVAAEGKSILDKIKAAMKPQEDAPAEEGTNEQKDVRKSKRDLAKKLRKERAGPFGDANRAKIKADIEERRQKHKSRFAKNFPKTPAEGENIAEGPQ